MCMIVEHANKLNIQFYYEIKSDLYLYLFFIANYFLDVLWPDFWWLIYQTSLYYQNVYLFNNGTSSVFSSMHDTDLIH